MRIFPDFKLKGYLLLLTQCRLGTIALVDILTQCRRTQKLDDHRLALFTMYRGIIAYT